MKRLYERPDNWPTMTPDERREYRQAQIDAPCPASAQATHGDPDNSGLCIYCGCILDLRDEDFGE